MLPKSQPRPGGLARGPVCSHNPLSLSWCESHGLVAQAPQGGWSEQPPPGRKSVGWRAAQRVGRVFCVPRGPRSLQAIDAAGRPRLAISHPRSLAPGTHRCSLVHLKATWREERGGIPHVLLRDRLQMPPDFAAWNILPGALPRTYPR